MEKTVNVKINYSKPIDKIRPMHAVNNGPCVAGSDQTRGNQNAYMAVEFPYARVHDASFYSGYGGEHTVDVHAIFPNFDADVNDPDSYDFACTDLYISQICQYGSKPFYRLGSKIEHGVKKYGTVMPKDFQKWAEICEHIILHYNYGWANGFNYGIEYWEIWNEPDLDEDEAKNKRCWSGTEADFATFYTVASKHLKKCFPQLKIGGPALAGNEEWLERFFERTKKDKPPMDFISWHWYWTEPYDVALKGERIRKIADKYGYEKSESILNEWNYVRSWTKEFVYSVKQIIGMKGAAFTSACMSACQNTHLIDMLMYYDARPGTFNGLFDFYTFETLKGYYPFYIFSKLYKLGTQVEATSDDEDIYVVSAEGNGRTAAMLTYYSEDDNKNSKYVTVEVNGADVSHAKVYIVDETRSMSEYLFATFKDGKLTLRLERNSIVYIEA